MDNLFSFHMIRVGSGSEETDEDYEDLFDYGAEYNYEYYGSGSGSSFSF